jgi:prolyl oligopeptidase
MLPSYRPTVGAAWLEKGGVYVVANIRGGGEFGPKWHQAALKANRHKAYDDFIGVAEDLIKRKVTSPPHLGIQGGSNGGLLMGNMLVRRPDLFGAIVCQVPLLDMKRSSRAFPHTTMSKNRRNILERSSRRRRATTVFTPATRGRWWPR